MDDSILYDMFHNDVVEILLQISQGEFQILKTDAVLAGYYNNLTSEETTDDVLAVTRERLEIMLKAYGVEVSADATLNELRPIIKTVVLLGTDPIAFKNFVGELEQSGISDKEIFATIVERVTGEVAISQYGLIEHLSVNTIDFINEIDMESDDGIEDSPDEIILIMTELKEWLKDTTAYKRICVNSLPTKMSVYSYIDETVATKTLPYEIIAAVIASGEVYKREIAMDVVNEIYEDLELPTEALQFNIRTLAKLDKLVKKFNITLSGSE